MYFLYMGTQLLEDRDAVCAVRKGLLKFEILTSGVILAFSSDRDSSATLIHKRQL